MTNRNALKRVSHRVIGLDGLHATVSVLVEDRNGRIFRDRLLMYKGDTFDVCINRGERSLEPMKKWQHHRCLRSERNP